MEMEKVYCRLIYNARTDPTWKTELNVDLCIPIDNCDECPYFLPNGMEV